MTIKEFQNKKHILKSIHYYNNLYILINQNNFDNKSKLNELKEMARIEGIKINTFFERICEEFNIKIPKNNKLKELLLSDLIISSAILENNIINLLLSIQLKNIKQEEKLKICYNSFNSEVFLKEYFKYKKFLEVYV